MSPPEGGAPLLSLAPYSLPFVMTMGKDHPCFGVLESNRFCNLSNYAEEPADRKGKSFDSIMWKLA